MTNTGFSFKLSVYSSTVGLCRVMFLVKMARFTTPAGFGTFIRDDTFGVLKIMYSCAFFGRISPVFLLSKHKTYCRGLFL